VENRASAHSGSTGLEAISVAVTLEGVTMTDTVEKPIARSREELDQPSLLPRAFEPLTRLLFTEAGLRSGMSVLDVSSGGGDVALLAREFVGPDGRVTGFDRSSPTVAYANERVAFRGLSNIEFVEADVENLPFGNDFDAIVGRNVLMYCPNPVGDLRTLVRCLRPGGLVVFQEFDMMPGKTVPPATVVDDLRAWLLDFFARAGLELEMGPKLYAAFKAAGLNAPQMRVDGFIGGAESICPELVANVARMMLPQAEALGAIKAEEVQIDTLEERIRADLTRTGGVMSTPLLIGAWARLPG
jgi:SAM-dependent methyltransferase